MVLEKNTSSDFDYPVHPLIQQRRSRRAYAQKLVEEGKIRSLFEAARWAPSSMNEQPWTYVYATKEQPELWQRIFDSLSEGNRIWVKNAPLLIVSIARKFFSRNGLVNSNARYDLSAANSFLTLQATELGLNVHQMGGYDGSVLRKNLHIPDAYEMGVVIAVGYPGDSRHLPDNLRLREEGPRKRLLQDVFVMNSAFPD